MRRLELLHCSNGQLGGESEDEDDEIDNFNGATTILMTKMVIIGMSCRLTVTRWRGRKLVWWTYCSDEDPGHGQLVVDPNKSNSGYA